MTNIITKPGDMTAEMREYLLKEDEQRTIFLDQIRELPALYSIYGVKEPKRKYERENQKYFMDGFKMGIEAVLDHIDNEGYTVFSGAYNINSPRHLNFACGLWAEVNT